MMNRNAEIVQNITSCTSDLLEEFKKYSSSPAEEASAVISNDCFRRRIRDYLQHSCYQFSGTSLVSIKNPLSIEFDSTFEWINSSAPCLATEATSKIIILEFFTHCCINCTHSINELRQILLELKTERTQRLNQNGCHISTTDFKLISIHSPKFSREQDPASLRAFVEKMSMHHSNVVNDPNRKLWQNLGIFCWPTILIFGPNPTPKSNELNLLFSLIGEGHGTELKTLLDTSAQYFDEVFDFGRDVEADGIGIGQLNIDQPLLSTVKGTNSLYYPGKVSICGQLLAISDSGNHRIITSTQDGILQELIGGSREGYEDGDFVNAQFSNPQGTTFKGESIFYVADTGNHTIRRVDLIKKKVTTLVAPNSTVIVENEVLTLKSPWDLTFYGPDVLLIAAAGNHQIFGYFFKSVELFRRVHEKDTFGLVAGTGREENRNNSYILKSSFAQPSGISVSTASPKLVFIADSESSSIRMIDGNGKVVGLAGGSRDPTDLFAFGDQDGVAAEAKLQHPVGVCASADGSKVFIADTYNHKVKVVDVETKRCTTIIGDGTAGDSLGSFRNTEQNKQNSSGQTSPDQLALLNEPGGLCIDVTGELLYIADTNNHTIKIASIKNKAVSSLELEWHQDTVDLASSVTNPSNIKPLEKLDDTFEVPYARDTPLRIELRIKNLPENYEGGEWSFLTSLSECLQSGLVSKSERNDGIIIIDHFQPIVPEATIRVKLFFCSKSACSMRSLNFLCHFKCMDNKTSESECSPIILVHVHHATAFQE